MLTLKSASLLLLLTASPAFADEVQGLVRITGNAAAQTVMVTPPGEFKGPEICRGDGAARVSHLESMVVKVTGDWKNPPDVINKCLEPKDIDVQKTTLGHDATVGQLVADKSGSYAVKGTDGKTTPLGEIPDGLKKLVGKKVILDLHQMPNPALKDAGSVVTSYSEFP